MSANLRSVLHAGNYLQYDGTQVASSAFVVGVTKPVPGVNVGYDRSVALTKYTGPGAGGTLNPTTGQTFTNIDFGTTHVANGNGASNVTFNNCLFTNSNNTGPAIINLDDDNHTGWQFTRCSFDNIHQYAYNINGIRGRDFICTRCEFHNMVDGLDPMPTAAKPDTDIAVQLLGCWIGDLAWYWNPNTGVVHPSDTKTHNDPYQWQGGQNMVVQGCLLDGHYSTTIGTGTPNSGNDTSGYGATSAPYTQATGESERYTIVDGGGTYADGKPGAHLGGSISGCMYTPVGRGTNITGHVFKQNWGGGGAYWMNMGATTITGTVSEISGCQVDNNQRDAGYAFGIYSGITVTNFGNPANVWTDGSGTIPRK